MWSKAHIFFSMAFILRSYSHAACTRSTWGYCMMWMDHHCILVAMFGFYHTISIKPSGFLVVFGCFWFLGLAVHPRMALCKANYFGVANDLQGQFDLAYESLKRFCKTERISCSQPPFKVRHAASLRDVVWCTCLYIRHYQTIVFHVIFHSHNWNLGRLQTRIDFLKLRFSKRLAKCSWQRRRSTHAWLLSGFRDALQI